MLSEHPERVDGGFRRGRWAATIAALPRRRRPARPAGGGVRALATPSAPTPSLLRELAPEPGRRAVERLIAATDAGPAAAAPLLDAAPRRGLRPALPRRPAPGQHPARARPAGAVRLHRVQRPAERDRRPVRPGLPADGPGVPRPDATPANRVLQRPSWTRRRGASGRGLWDGPGRPAADPVGPRRRCAPTSAPTPGDAGRPGAYLGAALAASRRRPPPALVAVGGLRVPARPPSPGLVAPGLGAAPGAVVLRSDEIRKRLWGRAPPRSAFRTEAYRRAPASGSMPRCSRGRRVCLAAGRAVMLDAASCARRTRRGAGLAAELARPFHGAVAGGAADLLRERDRGPRGRRLRRRPAVLQGQLARDPGQIDWAALRRPRPAHRRRPRLLASLPGRLAEPVGKAGGDACWA